MVRLNWQLKMGARVSLDHFMKDIEEWEALCRWIFCGSSLFLVSITLFQALRPQAMLQKRNFWCLTLQDATQLQDAAISSSLQQRKTWHHQRADPFDNPCLAWCCLATSSQCSMWTGFSDPRVHVWFASWSWEWKWWSVPAVAIRVASQNLIPPNPLIFKIEEIREEKFWIGREPRFRWQNFWRSKLLWWQCCLPKPQGLDTTYLVTVSFSFLSLVSQATLGIQEALFLWLHGLEQRGTESLASPQVAWERESRPWRYDLKRLRNPMLVKPIVYHAKYIYIYINLQIMYIYIICHHQGTEHWITRWGHNFSGHLWSVRGGSQSRNESSSSMSRRDGSAAKPGGWTVYNWHAYSLTVPLHFYRYCLVAYSQRSALQTQVFHNAPDGYNPQFVQSRRL